MIPAQPFAFPGEGMIIDGAVITPDTPLVGEEALDHLAGYGAARKRIREAREQVDKPKD